ncbi:MAG: TadE/TadG family type IV pilus assembly protein, partial [Actinomycetota bacterium]
TSSHEPNPVSDTRHESGQATVEFALILPVLLACTGLVLGAGLVARLQVQAWELAYLAGRTASLTAHDPEGEARAMVQQATDADWVVTTTVDEPLLHVRVSRRLSIHLPIVGRIDVSPITAHVTMYYEALG